MNKLIEIAKANGALTLPVSRNEQQYIFTGQQLRATVEQVCAPLEAAIEAALKGTLLDEFNRDEDGLASIWNRMPPGNDSDNLLKQIALLKKSLKEHRTLIGDKE